MVDVRNLFRLLSSCWNHIRLDLDLHGPNNIAKYILLTSFQLASDYERTDGIDRRGCFQCRYYWWRFRCGRSFFFYCEGVAAVLRTRHRKPLQNLQTSGQGLQTFMETLGDVLPPSLADGRDVIVMTGWTSSAWLQS